jgi:hypothetical protein
MKVSRETVSRLALALIIAASTLAICCASGGGSIPNESVQLAQIRGIETRLDQVLDVAIRTQLSGGRAAIVADDIATNAVNGDVAEIPIFRHKLYRLARVSGTELTLPALQQLRANLKLRVDEAYAAKGDLSKYSDLTSLTSGADGFAQSINKSAGIGR